MMFTLRAAGRALLPAETALPKRHWRLLWLAMAVRLIVGIPLFLILAGPYYAASVFISAVDWLGFRFHGFYAACCERDADVSGWVPPPAVKIPAPALSDEWQSRV